MDDVELVKRANGGDEAAFELLVRRHAPAAWRLANTLLRDAFAADEAVQDAFVKAHRSLHTFRGDAAFSTWLLSITRRVCIDRLRLKRAEVVSLDEARRERAAVTDAALRVAIEQAVAELPDVEREAFVLVDVLGHSREDAAVIVGVPASTMRSRVTRARERLADALTDADERREGRA
ncbi:MAG TPA: sigma-70 family RNA polymerase sigma factor [Acidimicrobiales bacterium]|jgi:RNA polymerase sigma-70 factor, ECF subfamily|nr:sigma-70 family RNA polymerase sigma factor [Acidimicrobiales bacterium]